MLEYQRPETTVTLDQGLREYYASRDGLVTGRGASESARTFFRCHDAAHVVFGCGTTLPHEAMVKMWSFFGTTAGFGLIADYRSPESKEIYETIGWSDVLATVGPSLRLVPRVVRAARRMHRPWPWHEFDEYRDVSLATIRTDFGIEVVSAS